MGKIKKSIGKQNAKSKGESKEKRTTQSSLSFGKQRDHRTFVCHGCQKKSHSLASCASTDSILVDSGAEILFCPLNLAPQLLHFDNSRSCITNTLKHKQFTLVIGERQISSRSPCKCWIRIPFSRWVCWHDTITACCSDLSAHYNKHCLNACDSTI